MRVVLEKGAEQNLRLLVVGVGLVEFLHREAVRLLPLLELFGKLMNRQPTVKELQGRRFGTDPWVSHLVH